MVISSTDYTSFLIKKNYTRFPPLVSVHHNCDLLSFGIHKYLQHPCLVIFLLYLILQYNALIHSRDQRTMLIELINQKEVVGDVFNQLRLALQRRTTGRPAQVIYATF